MIDCTDYIVRNSQILKEAFYRLTVYLSGIKQRTPIENYQM